MFGVFKEQQECYWRRESNRMNRIRKASTLCEHKYSIWLLFGKKWEGFKHKRQLNIKRTTVAATWSQTIQVVRVEAGGSRREIMVGKTRVVAAERVRRDPLQDIPLRICPQTRYRVCKKKKKSNCITVRIQRSLT